MRLGHSQNGHDNGNTGNGNSGHTSHSGNGSGGSGGNGAWTGWLRAFERKRRQFNRATADLSLRRIPAGYLARATISSFRLDGIDLTEPELSAALSNPAGRHLLRSRKAQRVRNHVAVLMRIERRLRANLLLTPAVVVRWYTLISSGLSTGRLADGILDRLDHVCRQVNSPHRKTDQALREIAHTHWQLLSDPVVPGFNGLLARLLLRYHLGRCGLPPVVFDPAVDAHRMQDEKMLFTRLVDLVPDGFNLLLVGGE